MSIWTREFHPPSLIKPQVLLLLPVAGGTLLIVTAATLLRLAAEGNARSDSPLAVPSYVFAIGVGAAMMFVPLRELLRVVRRPPSKYPTPAPEGDRPPDFPGVGAFGPLLRVATAIAAGRAYAFSGGLSAVGAGVFMAMLFDSISDIRLIVSLLGLGVGLLLLAWSGRYRLRTRVWVFRDGLACRARGRFAALKWAEVNWLVTTVGARLPPEERDTELGTGDGRSVRLPTELDDYDGLAEFVVGLAHQHLYPRLLARLDRGRALRFGDISVCATGVRPSAGADVIPWSRIGVVGIAWGTHAVVMKRDVPTIYWVRLPLASTPNVWLFLHLAKVLHPLQTAPPIEHRPWLGPKRADRSDGDPGTPAAD